MMALDLDDAPFGIFNDQVAAAAAPPAPEDLDDYKKRMVAFYRTASQNLKKQGSGSYAPPHQPYTITFEPSRFDI